MSKTEKAIVWMEKTAQDETHGYDQKYRWGERGDYDCSSAVITAWEKAGVPVKSNGASYTGNMLNVFKRCGFRDVTKEVNLTTGDGLIRGDVLLHMAHHVAMYCGNGKEVEASINERGNAIGGKPGDQTGKEFLIRNYRNFPWSHILRYNEVTNNPVTSNAPSKVKKYTGIVNVSDFLNVREHPNVNSDKCSFSPLYPDEEIDVCDTMSNGWLYIRKGKKYGYVSGNYVTRKK